MLILPLHPLRADFTSFGLALCTTGLLLGLVLWPLLGLPAALVVLVPALAAGGVAALHPGALAPLYQLWNRAARRYARLLRALLLRVGYHVVVRATARAGSRMRLGPVGPGASLWQPRGVVPPAARAPHGERWLRTYLAWSVQARRPTALALLPIVALLRLIEEPPELDEPQEVAENVYTLF